jgi:glycerophosphoryl diester phosphodiesterase
LPVTPIANFTELVETFEDAGIEGFITDFPDKVRAEFAAGVVGR